MHLLILGGSRADRLRAALDVESSLRPASRIQLDATTLPFLHPPSALLPVAQPRLIRLDDLERACPNHQITGTRLVLTQSTYLLQRWCDLLGPHDRIVATADRAALGRGAPEWEWRRGPWRFFDVRDAHLDDARSLERPASSTAMSASDEAAAELAAAFQLESADDRVTRCRAAMERHPDSAVVALATGSACREVQDLGAARRCLDRAEQLAPEWEAVHFESGKLWLGYDDMERARDAFQRAAELMPTFSAAFSNLGATLGELDQTDAALAAFRHAAKCDPDNSTILNNIGVVSREIGDLSASEDALSRVTELAPQFVFGHYNLGHTKFLRGDYPGALSAYEEGQRRDPEQNRRQGCRLALVRLANGDMDGATRDLWRFADAAPPDEREDLLLEAYEIAQALLAAHPSLAGGHVFVERIAERLTL